MRDTPLSLEILEGKKIVMCPQSRGVDQSDSRGGGGYSKWVSINLVDALVHINIIDKFSI